MQQRSYLTENQEQRERLRALAAALDDDALRRSVGHGWTVAATLAHLAFWDRQNLATLEEWERSGVKVSPVDPDPINDAMLPEWLAMPPRQAAAEALAAAEAVDRKVETLAPELVEAILARRPRTLTRAIHRREHLDEIDRALAGEGQSDL
ncbi:MAG: DinB family protein [Anaerolineae bacterium]|nr:DinB family protein [Anaerolineae bacterium]